MASLTEAPPLKPSLAKGPLVHWIQWFVDQDCCTKPFGELV